MNIILKHEKERKAKWLAQIKWEIEFENEVKSSSRLLLDVRLATINQKLPFRRV